MYMVIIKVDTYDHTVGTAEQRAAGEPQQSSNCRHVSTELPFTHTHTHTHTQYKPDQAHSDSSHTAVNTHTHAHADERE